MEELDGSLITILEGWWGLFGRDKYHLSSLNKGKTLRQNNREDKKPDSNQVFKSSK